jgi:hypothetical protein
MVTAPAKHVERRKLENKEIMNSVARLAKVMVNFRAAASFEQ